MNSVDKKCNHDVLIEMQSIKSNTGAEYLIGICPQCNGLREITERYKTDGDYGTISPELKGKVYSKRKNE